MLQKSALRRTTLERFLACWAPRAQSRAACSVVHPGPLSSRGLPRSGSPAAAAVPSSAQGMLFHLVMLFVWLAATEPGSRHLRQPDRPASRSNTTLPHPEALSKPRIMHGSKSRHHRQRQKHQNAHICMRQACPALLDAMPQLDASQTSTCSRS